MARDRLLGRSAQPRLELVQNAVNVCSLYASWRRAFGEPKAAESVGLGWLARAEQFVTESELEHAASMVFVAVQADLRHFGEGFRPSRHFEHTQLLRTWEAQHHAIRAFSASPAAAKELQLAASHGEPLAICVGRRARGRLLSRPEGCGAVIADCNTLHPPKFSCYCSDCRSRRRFARELNARDRAREWGRLSAPLPDGSFVYFATCRCGTVFKTLDVRQSRCYDCLERHR